MPTIDLSNNNQSSGNSPTNDNSSTNTPVLNNNPRPTQPPPPAQNNNWNDPWTSPWDQPMGGMNQGMNNSKRMSPQERVTMIENCYSEILGRKPDTRDINYYKYSTLSEEEIKKQLITGNEHKQLLQDGRDYKKLKERTTQSETRVKILEGQILDQVEEFKQLTNLLKEKNSYIQDLREKLNKQHNSNPFTIESKGVERIEPIKTIDQIPQQTHFVNHQTTLEKGKVDNNSETFIHKILKAFADLF